MKRVFLINFSSKMLIEVADKLKAAGVEVAYWQGYRDDFDHLDRTKYPGTVFHHAFDALKNIPPAGVSVDAFPPLDAERISRHYEDGWQALSMMGRADATGISFVEKRNYYYEYLKFWQGMLLCFKPDAILFSAIPHSATSFALYTLAKELHIKTVMINQLTVETRALLMDDYKTDSLQLKEESERRRGGRTRIEDLSPDLQAYYAKHQGQADATPAYKKLYAKGKPPFALPRPRAVMKHIRQMTLVRSGKSYLSMLFTKRKLGYIGPSVYGWRHKLTILKWQRMTARIEREYKMLEQPPDFDAKFIYVPLAFQPEQTTCPRGDVFDDQMLMLDILASSLPPGWFLYVKEHASQWYPQSVESHQYRYRGFYERIAKLPGARLIPAGTSTFELISHAVAVATVTGTAGWEALLRRKPVLLFGYIWYMYCAGVFRVSDVSSSRAALQRIAGGFRVEEQEVLNFLGALDVVSLKVRDYKTRTFKEDALNTFDDNVRVLSQRLLQSLGLVNNHDHPTLSHQ